MGLVRDCCEGSVSFHSLPTGNVYITIPPHARGVENDEFLVPMTCGGVHNSLPVDGSIVEVDDLNEVIRIHVRYFHFADIDMVWNV